MFSMIGPLHATNVVGHCWEQGMTQVSCHGAWLLSTLTSPFRWHGPPSNAGSSTAPMGMQKCTGILSYEYECYGSLTVNPNKP